MSISEKLERFKRGVMILVLSGAGVPMANAVTFDITAAYKPDPANPSSSFVNITPSSGFCTVSPSQCTSRNMFSARLPVTFASNKAIQANHADVRQGAMFKMPTGAGGWRTLRVTHANGQSESVQIRIAGFGSQYRLSDSASNLIGEGGADQHYAHGKLWGGHLWSSGPAGCPGLGYFGISPDSFNFFWLNPVPNVCSVKPSYPIAAMSYSYLDVAFEMRMPNPLRMTAGHYTGALTMGIGPGQELDFGDVMIPSDSVLTLNFNFDVDVMLKVEIPPGGNLVELVPEGGWHAWLSQGRRPTRLFRDQTFNISASSRFNMWLECQYSSGNSCALISLSPVHISTVDISVSLPHGLTDAAGQPITRRLLADKNKVEVHPGSFIDRKAATLHFEIPRDRVEAMLAMGTTAYSGFVTVIWDSEV
jgi:hypothetical protein